jgi:tRNA 2-thiouridine synthesizing protein A
MSQTIDARGLSCPQPVLLTQKHIKAGNHAFEVLVDSTVSRENVVRCIEKNGLAAKVSGSSEEFVITVSES